MSLTYADIGSHLFGERIFRTSDFARLTGNPRAAKVLSELVIRGVVTRTGRGCYRFLRPAERPDLRASEWGRVRSIVLNGPEPKAWDGATAVEIWTRGAYRTSPSLYSRSFHVLVPAAKVNLWKNYLGKHHVATHSRKRIGARVDIRGTRHFRRVVLDGEPVIPRDHVVSLVRSKPGVFADAEGMIVDRPRSS